MPEYPNAHPGAPLALWLLKPSAEEAAEGLYIEASAYARGNAIEYIRKDAADAMLTHAVNEPPRPELRTALATALELLEDNDADGATRILRRCLSRL